MDEHFKEHMQNCVCHCCLVKLLSAEHCVKLRHAACRKIPGAVHVLRDCADALVACFSKEVSSTHFGENASVSMEGMSVRCTVDGNEEREWHSYLSDDHQQDARTAYLNTDHFVAKLRGEQCPNLLPVGSVLFEQSDGCAKQHRCGNALFFMSALADKWKICVDRMITAPHHGKGECDSQGGTDKNCLRNCFLRPTNPESSNGETKCMAAHTCSGSKRSSMANRMVDALSDPTRTGGLKGGKKHQKREGNVKIKARHCTAMHHGNTDTAANCKVPLAHTTHRACGFPSGGSRNKLGAHHHFYADHHMGVGTVAARRIPCACDACEEVLRQEWVPGVSVRQQPKFQSVADCKHRASLGSLNDWRILDVKPVAGRAEQEEIEEFHGGLLDARETAAAMAVTEGGFGAIDADRGHHIVRWTTTARELEEDSDNVEGMRGSLAAGELVADGVHWNPVGRAPKWHTPPAGEPEVLTFRLRRMQLRDMWRWRNRPPR